MRPQRKVACLMPTRVSLNLHSNESLFILGESISLANIIVKMEEFFTFKCCRMWPLEGCLCQTNGSDRPWYCSTFGWPHFGLYLPLHSWFSRNYLICNEKLSNEINISLSYREDATRNAQDLKDHGLLTLSSLIILTLRMTYTSLKS